MGHNTMIESVCPASIIDIALCPVLGSCRGSSVPDSAMTSCDVYTCSLDVISHTIRNQDSPEIRQINNIPPSPSPSPASHQP